MQNYLILLLVVGIISNVAFESYDVGYRAAEGDDAAEGNDAAADDDATEGDGVPGNANANQGGNNIGEGGQVNDDYSGSSVDDVSTPSESGSDSQDPPSASSSDGNPEYFFEGNIYDDVAFRDGGEAVPFEAPLSGQVFLSRKDFRKLAKMQNRGGVNAVQATAKGFAVSTGKKNACAGIHEATIDLFFIMSTFCMKYQGKVTFTSYDLEAMGGEEGLIKINGLVSLHFSSAPREKRDDRAAPNGYMLILSF